MVAATQVFTGEVASTIVDVLKWRGQNEANRCAYSFLNRGKIENITYGELDLLARRLAGRLLEQGLHGERAILSLPTGESFLAGLFGCMYAGTTAVPVFPPRGPADARRLVGIIRDSRAKAVLTLHENLSALAALNLASLGATNLFCMAVDDPLRTAHAVHALSPHRSGAPALLQYTSGSTGKPRGVINTHANLMANLEAMRRAFGNDPQKSRVVSWLPTYHDMGLIGGILECLYVGMPALLLSPVTFLKRPLSWLEAIRDYRATTSGGPNFAFDLCVRRTTPEQRAALDLSTWEVAFCGAEPIRHESLEAFAEAFGPSGFRRDAFFPCYGLAESTLMVTGVPKLSGSRVVWFDAEGLMRDEAVPGNGRDVPCTGLVSCGTPVEGATVTIVDPKTLRAKAPGEVGEIWVTGPSVASGYWDHPEDTQEVFRAKRVGESRPHLRTGDLGFVRDGELFVTGRCKDLVIVRGANHYPHDIEASVQACSPELRSGRGVAFSISAEGGEELVIVQEVERGPSERQKFSEESQTLLGAIVEAVSLRHGMRPYAIVLVARGTIPVTSSGKLQRQETKKAYLAGELDPLGTWIHDRRSRAEEGRIPANANANGEPFELAKGSSVVTAATVERWLCEKLATLLKMQPEGLDPNSTFGRLGVDSVSAMEALLELENAFQLALEPAHFYDHPTPRALARWVAQTIDERKATTAAPVSRPTHSRVAMARN
jgi:acyl-CoA synthetase (AMP-forming)/AMP-acid ligase II/acyl carrier protein